MKTNAISILFLFLSAVCSAQITSYRIEQKKDDAKTVNNVQTYDSLTNITRENLPLLVGQQVQIVPNVSKAEVFAATLHSSKPDLSRRNKTIVEPSSSNSRRSKVGAFDNDIFDIIGVDSLCDDSETSHMADFYLIVKNENYSTPHYLEVGSTTVMDYKSYGRVTRRDELRVCPALMIVGYFNKLKETSIGKKLIKVPRRKYSTAAFASIYNLSNGEMLSLVPDEQVWTVKDVAMIENKGLNELCYILSSESQPDAFVKVKDNGMMDYQDFVKMEEEKLAEKAKDDAKRKAWEADMKKKYGATNGALIAQGKIKIGFTKVMCEEAWGTPDKVNTTTGSWGVHEQWVYDYKECYLYFENGKLTAIQD